MQRQEMAASLRLQALMPMSPLPSGNHGNAIPGMEESVGMFQKPSWKLWYLPSAEPW